MHVLFIIDGYQNSMFCSLASTPRRDYEKQRLLIGQLSFRKAVSQACPSGQNQG